MYRSSLTLAFVVLYSAAGAASDLHPSTWRRAESTRHPLMSMCVRRRPIGNRLTQNPVTDIGSPLMGRRAAYRAPASVYGEYGPAYAAQPAYVERAPAYPERYYAPSVTTLPSPTTVRIVTTREERDYALEYAPRPPLPVPYRSRARCDDGYGRWVSCD